MTRFEGHLDDWPALHYARSLLETDDVDHYLLLMYAHWAHHCARGSLASYEQVSIRPDEFGLRYAVAGQVVPCQVMVPIMLRWGLVYEERDNDVLWFCRAIPRRWLEKGSQLLIENVPTRFGPVGFTIEVSSRNTARISISLRPAALFWPAIKLRLRAPEGKKLVSVKRGRKQVEISGETVTVYGDFLENEIELTAKFA